MVCRSSCVKLFAKSSNAGDGWSINTQIYDAIPPGSPIAAASSFSNVSTGYESWIELLSQSNRGIKVSTWSGAINGWLQQYANPSVMAKYTSDENVFGSVAVTASGDAFGVLQQHGQADSIQHWRVADDMLDWSSIGSVDLGGAWD